ncbi:unnamed protein product [Allacma fusca]|uniref:Odorant receptor n=1 Tax=Allacma fusca TaxID=39272 RepID=A0A8J2K839_9HEXA|nr:unnamed protein product [Allacma fusca]
MISDPDEIVSVCVSAERCHLQLRNEPESMEKLGKLTKRIFQTVFKLNSFFHLLPIYKSEKGYEVYDKPWQDALVLLMMSFMCLNCIIQISGTKVLYLHLTTISLQTLMHFMGSLMTGLGTCLVVSIYYKKHEAALLLNLTAKYVDMFKKTDSDNLKKYLWYHHIISIGAFLSAATVCGSLVIVQIIIAYFFIDESMFVYIYLPETVKIYFGSPAVWICFVSEAFKFYFSMLLCFTSGAYLVMGTMSMKMWLIQCLKSHTFEYSMEMYGLISYYNNIFNSVFRDIFHPIFILFNLLNTTFFAYCTLRAYSLTPLLIYLLMPLGFVFQFCLCLFSYLELSYIPILSTKLVQMCKRQLVWEVTHGNGKTSMRYRSELRMILKNIRVFGVLVGDAGYITPITPIAIFNSVITLLLIILS